MFVVGLTGGIGSGKTAVSDRFATRGITIVDADIAARVVVEPGQPALTSIAEHFGEDILTANGELDRAALRAKVFADPDERVWLEALLHPRISECIGEQLAAAKSAYAVLVSPLLFETNQIRFTNRVLVVDVPEELQLERTMARDDNDEAGSPVAERIEEAVADKGTSESSVVSIWSRLFALDWTNSLV